MVMEGFTMILGVAFHRASDRKFSIVLKWHARRKRGGPEPKREDRKKDSVQFFADRPWRLWRRSADPGAGGNVRVDVIGPH